MSSLIVITAALAAQTAAPAAPAQVNPAAGAQAGASTYLDVEAGVGYASNPLLSFSTGSGRGFGRIALHAVHTRQSARSTTVLSGYAENLVYTGRYGAQQSFDLNARHSTAVNEKLRLFGDFNASYDKGGQLDTRFVGVPDIQILPGTPGGPPQLLPPSGDFLSVTGRRYQLSGHIGAQVALSARENLTMSTGAERVVFRSGQINTSYTTIPVSVAYDNQIGPRTTIGARVSAQNTNYDGPSSTRLITPQLTGRFLLSERLTLTGAVGVSFASIDDGTSTRHSTGLSAEGGLCTQDDRGSLCARVAVDQQTATVAGPVKSVSGGIDYSRRLSANETLQLSLSATRYSTPTSIIAGSTFSSSTYYRAAASYTRRLGDRLFAGADIAARKLTEAGPDPKADVSGSLFIRYRFGSLQ